MVESVASDVAGLVDFVRWSTRQRPSFASVAKMATFPLAWLLLAVAVATLAISMRCPGLALRDCLTSVVQVVANDLVSGGLPMLASRLR